MTAIPTSTPLRLKLQSFNYFLPFHYFSDELVPTVNVMVYKQKLSHQVFFKNIV